MGYHKVYNARENLTDQTMDSPRYYECGNDNTYCVHFPNKAGYTNTEITNIFSEFGNVVGVTKAGDDYGFRFVRYRREGEAQRCVEGLKNHRTIMLLPKKPKQASNGQRKNNRTNKQESRESRTTWASWEQKKSDDSGKFRQNNAHRTAHREYNNRRPDDENSTDNCQLRPDGKLQQRSVDIGSPKKDEIKDKADANKYETKDEADQKKNERNSEADPKKDHRMQAKNLQEVRDIGADTVEPTVSQIQQQVSPDFDKVCKPTTSSITPIVAADTSIETTLRSLLLQTVLEETANGLTNLTDENKPEYTTLANTTSTPAIPPILPETNGEDLPKLVKKSRKAENTLETKKPPPVAPKVTTVQAEAIVVANVHTDYGIHYILHLFQKHDPIGVSPMRIILKHGLRYCVVYLQSALQAYDIEEKFDNYSLCGKELIVLRAQRLAPLAGDV